MNFKVEAGAGMFAFGVTAAFICWPSSFLMAVFAFFIQPLFLILAFLYLRRVFRELRSRKVL
jgi:hypothetical protein